MESNWTMFVTVTEAIKQMHALGDCTHSETKGHRRRNDMGPADLRSFAHERTL